jgi:hypothetical protein
LPLLKKVGVPFCALYAAAALWKEVWQTPLEGTGRLAEAGRPPGPSPAWSVPGAAWAPPHPQLPAGPAVRMRLQGRAHGHGPRCAWRRT